MSSKQYSNLNHTFEWYQALLNKLTIIHITQVATSTGRPQQSIRDFKFISSQHREGHDSISNNAANRWDVNS